MSGMDQHDLNRKSRTSQIMPIQYPYLQVLSSTPNVSSLALLSLSLSLSLWLSHYHSHSHFHSV